MFLEYCGLFQSCLVGSWNIGLAKNFIWDFKHFFFFFAKPIDRLSEETDLGSPWNSALATGWKNIGVKTVGSYNISFWVMNKAVFNCLEGLKRLNCFSTPEERSHIYFQWSRRKQQEKCTGVSKILNYQDITFQKQKQNKNKNFPLQQKHMDICLGGNIHLIVLTHKGFWVL